MQYESTLLRPRTQDLTAQSFDRLTVLRFAGYVHGNAYWTCQCSCGTTKDIGASSLRDENTRSCGCLRRESTRKNKTIHGKRHTPEYRAWHHIRQRCENPSDAAYNRYGGRGITVCEAWHDFATFYEDMGPRPSPEHSIDRRDNNGSYEKTNCYWATDTEQARNKRNNHLLTFNGITQCLEAWSVLQGLRPETIRSRLHKGCSIEEALTVPPEHNHEKIYCRQGHALFGDNLLLYQRKNGRTERICKRCRNDRVIRHAQSTSPRGSLK